MRNVSKTKDMTQPFPRTIRFMAHDETPAFGITKHTPRTRFFPDAAEVGSFKIKVTASVPFPPCSSFSLPRRPSCSPQQIQFFIGTHACSISEPFHAHVSKGFADTTQHEVEKEKKKRRLITVVMSLLCLTQQPSARSQTYDQVLLHCWHYLTHQDNTTSFDKLDGPAACRQNSVVQPAIVSRKRMGKWLNGLCNFFTFAAWKSCDSSSLICWPWHEPSSARLLVKGSSPWGESTSAH